MSVRPPLCHLPFYGSKGGHRKPTNVCVCVCVFEFMVLGVVLRASHRQGKCLVSKTVSQAYSLMTSVSFSLFLSHSVLLVFLMVGVTQSPEHAISIWKCFQRAANEAFFLPNHKLEPAVDF